MAMSENHQSRRAFLALLAAAGGVVAAGGAAWAVDARNRADYEDAVETTWRHGSGTSLSSASRRRELVRYATLAANSHNTQPWLFHLADRSIFVLQDPARHLPIVDPDLHHVYASLGCAVENMVQAARVFGLQAIPIFDTVAHGIRVELATASPERTALFDAIPHRQSTRTAYEARAVPLEHLRFLEAAGNGNGVRMLLFTERRQREDILSYLIAANRAQMDNVAFVDELKLWIRFNYEEALSTRDGLFSKCAGNPALPKWAGRLIFPLVFTKHAEDERYANQLRNSAGIAVFVSDKNEPEHWVEAGRCSQRFALQATALGIRHAFINQPVEVPAVRGQFAAYLGVGDRRPDLVMRFGYGPELPRSLRRPIEQVILHA